MKNTVILIIVIILAGCVPSKVTKRTFYLEMINTDFSERILREKPYMFYCFDKDENQLKNEMQEGFKDCVNETNAGMPALLTSSESKAFGFEVGTCLNIKYLRSNKPFYSTKNLTSDQVTLCKKLKEKMDQYSN